MAARRLHRGRLFRKYFVLILLLVCGTLVISGGIGLYFAYQENKVALASLQREKAGAAAARIEEFVRQVEQQLAFAALPALGAGGSDQRILEFQKVLRIAQAVTDIAYVDAKGREQILVSRLAMNTVGSGKDRSQEPAFRNAAPDQTWYGPVYFRKDTEPYMTMAVRSGRAGPVTVAEVNLKFIWDVITRIKIGQKGKAYVVDATGHLVADPDIGLVLRKTDLSGLAQVKAALVPDADDSLAMLARDVAGGNVLTAHAPIEPGRDLAAQGKPWSPLGWKVFVEQPVSEVFAALDATILRTIALLVAGLLFSALAALSLARSMVRPIATLQAGAARIGAGDLEQKIEVKTGDELESLADEFNRMSARLRESYAGLEKKVEERTAELRQALEFQGATGEILSSMSSSIADTQPVFDAIVNNLMRLFGTQFAVVQLLRDGRIHLAAIASADERFKNLLSDYPRPLDDQTVSGRAMLKGEVIQYASMTNDPAVPPASRRHSEKAGSWEAIISAPMLRDGRVVGAIVTARRTPGLFDDKQVALIKAFADQAVIAIENVRLFNETKEALEQQTATSEILKVISSSTTNTQPVFEAIVRSGLNLFPDAAVAVVLPEGDKVRMAAVANNDRALADAMLSRFPIPLTREYMHGTAILDRRVIEVPDAERHEDSTLAPGIRNFLASGARAITVMPMVRGNAAIGAVSVTRRAAGPLSDKQLALLRTFADQAVIAIENVRLFNETKEALEQQTAIGEVLRVISGTLSDVKPVLEAVAERAARLCDASAAAIYVLEGDVMSREAFHGPQALQGNDKLPYSPNTLTGRAVQEGRPLHVHDIGKERELYPLSWQVAKQFGHHTMLAVPLMREGKPFGAMFLRRGEVKPFSEQQIALSMTFADQAAIAIQNVRLFNEIQEKSRQLEIANKHKSDFLANMSHELRTPLNAIIGFSEVLIERMFGEVNAKQADYLKDIHESGKHLLSLINDILDLSKIEAGRMDLEISSFHLPSALSNAMTLVRERAQRHGIALGLEVDPRLGELRADERKVKQILVNLLSNAVKFTPDGGKVDVFAKTMDGRIEIAVRDTGIGIAPEDQALVFEEFKQVGRDARRKAEGTGLGLALTKRFVELHGGAIRLESAPGKGSTFTITLPIRP